MVADQVVALPVQGALMTMPRLQAAERWLAVCCLLVVAGLAGCSRRGTGDSMIAAANPTNVHRLCNLYNYFQARNGWQGPVDEASLRDFIGQQPERILQRMGINATDLDLLFTSERDGQPFDIRYGVPGSSRGSDEPVVFERTGLNGLRMVGFTSTKHREVAKEEYDRLRAGQK
jgi:hypothetical protein